jgi:hypothetical protein
MSIYTLQVELDKVEPQVWRRIRVPGGISMRGLHEVLQWVLGWSQCHLYEFRIGDTCIGLPDEEYGATDVVDETVSVEETLPGEGESFEYLYDFGDSWSHVITVKTVEEGELETPEIEDGENAAPPEDVGGVWGYKEFLEALNDPDHPEHQMYSDWIVGDWDEHEFDRKLRNQILKDINWETRKPV